MGVPISKSGRMVRVVAVAMIMTFVGPDLSVGANAVAQAVPEVTFTSLSDNATLVKVVAGDGSQLGANLVALRHPDGSVLVDTNFQHPALAQLIRRSVEARVGPLALVVITHWHPDHSGGIAAYEDLPVYAHPNVIARLSEETEGIDLGGPGTQFTSPPREPAGLPNHGAEGGEVLLNGSVVLHHLSAAHTDGDLVVQFPAENVVATGDVLWPDRFPSIDLHNGGSVRGLRTGVDRILEIGDDETVFAPGHGDAATRAQVSRFAAMLDATIESIVERRRTEAGGDVSPPELAAWEDWAHTIVPVDQWIALLRRSLSADGGA